MLDFLIMLVLLHVKSVVGVPSEGHSELQTKQTVLHSAFVAARAHGSVSEGHEFVMVRFEGIPGIFG